jgi:hypothetical protein
MPCGCKIPIENYPETADWGPLFWKLLHGLAEHAGTQTDTNLRNDERRIWTHLLKSLHDCIPCDICQDHYNRWITVNLPVKLDSIPYTTYGFWVRNWLWRLHNEINEGNEKPLFQESDLTSTYKEISITDTWKALEPVMKRAILLNGISLLPWKKWLSYVRMLQGLYGI